MFDTITAISSPIGFGAIGIIRISGSLTVKIISNYFRSKENKKPRDFERRIILGQFHFFDAVIDEVCVIFYKSPNSYTGEDMAELFTHGNPIIQDKIISSILREGARLAKEGEFTKRAYLNGKMDLIKAESLCEMINARSEVELANARRIFGGEFSTKIDELKSQFNDLLSYNEAMLEFDEEIDRERLIAESERLKNLITPILNTFSNGKKIKGGFCVAICGKPNAGKSTLFNTILKSERSIVSQIPGTTRDFIDGELLINGKRFIFYDTAGMWDARNEIEQEGIKRTKDIIKRADLVIFLIDGGEAISDNDFVILEYLKDKKYIFVLSKCDSASICDYTQLIDEKPLLISSLTGENIDALLQRIENEFSTSLDKNSLFLTSERQFESLNRSIMHIDRYINLIKKDSPLDVASCEIRDSIEALDELIGRVRDEEIINNIFSKFCVGK